MNFREKFEQWHLKRYGYKAEGKGTALNYTYKQPTIQQRWEGWQACDTQSFEDGYAKGKCDALLPDNAEISARRCDGLPG